MENLAGEPVEYTTRQCADELDAAGIDVIPNPTPPDKRGEVDSSVIGELHGFTFRRLWYYWSVSGEMPLWAAEAMYATPVGRTDVRVAGHCGCPAPREWVRWIGPDHVEVVDDPDGSIEAQLELLAKTFPSMRDTWPRFSRNIEQVDGVRAIVDCYHVDSAEGLKLLADTIRAIQPKGAGSTME